MATPTEIGNVRDELRRAVGAETLLKVIVPLFQDRLETLITQMAQSPADLATLLDYRAKLAEALRIIRELRALAGEKQNASQALINIFGPQGQEVRPPKKWFDFWS